MNTRRPVSGELAYPANVEEQILGGVTISEEEAEGGTRKKAEEEA